MHIFPKQKLNYECTGSPPLTRFFGPEKTVLNESRAIEGVFLY